MRSDDTDARNYADELYEKLQSQGLEVLYDDRKVSAGIMFSDADLLGIPVRLIVSPRNMKQQVCEIVTRDKTVQKQVDLDSAVQETMALVQQLLNSVNDTASR